MCAQPKSRRFSAASQVNAARTRPLFVSLNLHEIHHLRNLLEAEGVPCQILNEGLSTLAGEVPFIECAMQLWLKDERDRARAEEVLRRFRFGLPPALPPWRCVCGEELEGQFSACWNCGAVRR